MVKVPTKPEHIRAPGASTSSDPTWTADLLRAPHDAPDKAGRVRRMFNAIAPRYELVNALFSFGRDAYWRRKSVDLAGSGPGDDVLDIACGTGDFARAFGAAGVRSITGCDFAHEMLMRARSDPRSARPPGLRTGRDFVPPAARWVEGDALRLPFGDGTFSITSCAFGVRNFDDLGAGLAEMYRVLRPGGRAVILEFTRPANPVLRRLYEVYSTRVMPLAATIVSGDRSGAYRYLPRSVVSFLSTEQMRERLKAAGFGRSTATPLTMGVVTVYVAARD